MPGTQNSNKLKTLLTNPRNRSLSHQRTVFFIRLHRVLNPFCFRQLGVLPRFRRQTPLELFLAGIRNWDGTSACAAIPALLPEKCS
jgi:hypothetical protein